MRLIYKGRILKDDQTLTDFKIEDGGQVHLVKGKTAGGAAQAQPTAPTETASAGTAEASNPI